MSFLADAATHATRSDPTTGVAWEILSNLGQNPFKVTYTNADGVEESVIFETLKDAANFTDLIHTFWKTIEAGNELFPSDKNVVYRRILDWVLLEIQIFGNSNYPGDVKKAINEIETHLGANLTMWN